MARVIVSFAARALPAMALVAGIVASSPAPARGADATSLTIEVPQTLAVGTHLPVTVRLRSNGSGVEDQPVSLRLDGRGVVRIQTGPTGEATITVSKDLAVGRHTIQALFAGSSEYTAARSPAIPFTVEPMTLVVTTVPPVEGLPLFAVDDGPPLVTDRDGAVRIEIAAPRSFTIEVLPQREEDGRRVGFGRWGDGAGSVVRRVIRAPFVTRLSVGLELQRLVNLAFFDPKGREVLPNLIDSVEVRNGRGDATVVDVDGGTWLPENRLVRPEEGLRSDTVLYSLEGVVMRDQNIVNRGQQRFEATTATWRINVLLFDLAIYAQDVVTGQAVGDHAKVVYPDGTTEIMPLGPGSAASIRGLPRGDYSVALSGASGIALVTPVALSRDQDARLALVSVFDLGLGAVAFLVAAVGLILLGRRTAVRRFVVGRRWRGAGT